MKTVSIKINKASTVIEGTGMFFNAETDQIDCRNHSCFSFKTRTELFNYISQQEAFSAVISVNVKGMIKKVESLGFEVSVDPSFGFDWEVKIFATK